MEEQDRSSKRRKHEKSADSAGMVAAAQAFLTRTPLSAVARQDQKLTVLEHSDTVARAMQVHATAFAAQDSIPGCAWTQHTVHIQRNLRRHAP